MQPPPELDVAEAYGLRFEVVPSDIGVGACLRDYGEFARPELDLIRLMCAGDFVDVGANIGAIALPFAKAKPAAKVLTIEALPAVAAILTRNVEANGLRNVTVLNAVAGETSGRIVIPNPPLDAQGNLGARSLYEKGHPTAPARMVRLDDVAPDGVGFVKVDVEGFEPRVLDGAGRLLAEARPAWLVEVSATRPNAATKVRSALAAHGYRLYWFYSPFLTRRRPRRLDEHPPLRGDLSILALDGEPPWPLNPVGDEWPTDLAAFPYLGPYGLGGQ